MKNLLTKFFGKKVRGLIAKAALAGALACGFGPSTAEAQTYGSITIAALATNLGVSSNQIICTVINMNYNRHISLQVSAKAQLTATTLTLYGIKSNDALTWETTNSFGVTLQVPTNSWFSTNVDIDVGAAGWFQITNAVVGSGGAITNSAASVGLKPGV